VSSVMSPSCSSRSASSSVSSPSRTWGLLSWALVAALLGSCHERPPATNVSPRRNPDRSVRLEGTTAEYVKVEPAAKAPLQQARWLVGQIAFDERHLATIGPPVQGRVSSVAVVVGDKVKQGQVLLTIHAPDIAAARAQVVQARTARTLAERNAERARLLVERGAGSDAERLQAEAALSAAKTEEERASSALKALGTELGGASEYQLRSPIAGIVVERNVSVGTEVHVDQDAAVVKVADLSTVWVTADVYEQDLARIKIGDEAAVEVSAFPGHTLTGKITSIGSTADPQTRVVRARVELPNPDLALRPGMFARVEVRGAADGAVEVPLGALLARRDQFFVFVRDRSGNFRQREVRPGEQHGEHVAILSGLAPGEPVVVEGAILLDAEANEAL